MNYEISYIAGFFDGEGSIGIKNAGSLSIRFHNTNRDVLEFIKKFMAKELKIFDVKISEKKKYSGNHKTCLLIEICGDKAKKVLECMLPYLIIKKDVSKLAIEYQNLQHKWRGSKPARIKRRMDEIKTKIRELNKRGL